MKTPYTYTYRFAKRFNAKSLLCGIEIVDRIRFTSRKSAAEWARGIRRNAERLPYRILPARYCRKEGSYSWQEACWQMEDARISRIGF